MKPEILALFTDSVQASAAKLFEVDLASLKSLGGFENYVCEGLRKGKPCILRITDDSHRVAGEVLAELDWVNYLAGHGVSVCRPIRSVNGNLVESCQSDQSEFVVSCFEKAKGQGAWRVDMTAEMIRNRGRLVGRMHALTKKYEPGVGQPRREHWFENDDFAKFRSYLRPADTKVIERFDELISKLRSIETGSDCYGLIHQDAHQGNLFFDGAQPTLFDFDDCSYDFFVSDIAIALFYSVLMIPDESTMPERGRDFLRHLLEGYREENRLDNRWLELIPTILKRREIVLYVAVHRASDIDNLDDWGMKYMTGRREKIENGVPFLDIDLGEFVE